MTDRTLSVTRNTTAALGAVLACTLSACKEEGVPLSEYDALVVKMERLHDDIEDLKKDQAEEKARLLKQVDEAVEDVTEVEAKVQTLEAEVEAAREESDAILNEFEEYKKEYRVSIRQRAKGLTFPQVAKLDGTVFKDVTVSKLDPVEIRFLHTEGIGSLPLSELNPEYMEIFGFDEAEALVFIESKKQETEPGGDEVAYEQDAESKVDYDREFKKLAAQRQINSDLSTQLAEQLKTTKVNLASIEQEISEIRRKGKGAFLNGSSKDPATHIKVLQQKSAALREMYNSLYRQYQQAKK